MSARYRAMLLGACLAPLLTSCAHYRPRPIEPDASANRFMARSLQNPQLQRYLRKHDAESATRFDWDLRNLTWVAFYYQPDLDAARAQWQAAKAAAITAGAHPNPTLDITNQYNVDAAMGISPWTIGPALGLPLEAPGKRRARVLEAQHRAEAARLNFADKTWQIRGHVREAFLQTYPVYALIEREQRSESQLVEVIGRRVRAGEASGLDLMQARIALQKLTLEAQESHKQHAESRVRLATALGLPVQALDSAKLSFKSLQTLPAADAIPSRTLRRLALLNRPDVRAALADYEASQAALQGEIAKQYPDITLGPGFQWDAGQAKWSLGLSLTLPIFNQNQGPIAEARARREEAAARFVSTQAKAIGEIDQAIAGYQQVTKKLATANALLADQRKTNQSAQAFYDAGQTDSTDLLGAHVELAVAELDRARAVIEAQQALGALEDALRQLLDGTSLHLDAVERSPRFKDALL